MSAAIITQLLIAFGPAALNIIPELAAIWSKPELSLEEVQAFCDRSRKSYDDYINEARAAATTLPGV